MLLLFGGLYVVLFTGPGNGIVKPILEGKLDNIIEGEVRLEEFMLRPGRFAFEISLDRNSKVVAKGSMNLFARSIDAAYDLTILELSRLEHLINYPLKGPLNTSGTVRGNLSGLFIKGMGDVASGKTGYQIKLIDFEPKSVEVTIKDARIEEILHLLNQPHYASGLLEVTADVSNINLKEIGMDGLVKTKIHQGKVNGDVVNKEFDMTLPQQMAFKCDAQTRLEKNLAISKVDFLSDIADLFSQRSVANLQSAAIESDYKIRIPDLDKLYFATNRHLKGSLEVDGEIKMGKTVLATGKSNILGGTLDFRLENNIFNANLRDIQTLAVSDMLLYPKIFSSSGGAEVNYDLAAKRGVLEAELKEGKILPNQLMTLLSSMAKFDIRKEVYGNISLKSEIDDEIILSELYMKSRHTTINSENAEIDLDNEKIDAKIEIAIKGTGFIARIKGNINKPKVNLDASALLKAKATDKLEKKLEKKLPEEFKEPVKKLFDFFRR